MLVSKASFPKLKSIRLTEHDHGQAEASFKGESMAMPPAISAKLQTGGRFLRRISPKKLISNDLKKRKIYKGISGTTSF
jgi:hypothetical protein